MSICPNISKNTMPRVGPPAAAVSSDDADDAPARGRATKKPTEWFTPAGRVRWRVLAMGIDDDDGGGGCERRRDLDRRRDDADHQGRFGIVRGDHRGTANAERDARMLD